MNHKSCIDLVPIFDNLTMDEKKEIAYISNAKNYGKGETIYNQGDTSKDLYIVHKGKVKISRFTKDGKEQVLRTLEPGSFMGELSLFLEDEHADFATVMENTEICHLDGDKFKDLLVEMPTISLKLLREMSQRLDDTENTVESMGVMSVEARIVNKLFELAKGQSKFELPYSKRDMASLLGMSSETLSRKLRELESDQLIGLKGQRGIELLDLDALESLM